MAVHGAGIGESGPTEELPDWMRPVVPLVQYPVSNHGQYQMPQKKVCHCGIVFHHDTNG